ncbi:MAG: leucine-rich repeat domain-containing protein, partial [Ruminococcus sp.]|nr:leucine-rich repeat domain-containing protein [Ruminococcus sp.]
MRFKKIIAVAAAFVMAAGIGGAFPENTVWEDVSVTASAASDFTVKTDENGVKFVAGYTGKGGNITIPSNVGYIGKNAFWGNTSITGVTIPKSCTAVGETAFNCCTELKKVVFEGDASIGVFAFSNCVNLESVTVKGSIVDGIYNGAFSECQSLKTVKINGNKHKFIIDFYAFFDCYSLTSINIPSGCTQIYGCAFLNCFNLTKLTIPAKTEIVTDHESNNYQFGYARIFPTEEDCIAHEEGRDYKTNTFVAGKKSMYSQRYSSDPTGEYFLLYDVVYYTPKAITLTVTKGS